MGCGASSYTAICSDTAIRAVPSADFIPLSIYGRVEAETGTRHLLNYNAVTLQKRKQRPSIKIVVTFDISVSDPSRISGEIIIDRLRNLRFSGLSGVKGARHRSNI